MAGTVVNDKFQAQNGFESPSFNVDTAGKITGVSLDVQSILLNGKAFVQAETGDTSDDTGTTVSNSFDSLAVNGGVFKVNDTNNNTILSVINSRIVINNIGIPGTIENVDIGYTTPGQIRAYGIDMTTAPDSSASNINASGTNLNGDVTVTDNLLMQKDPTVGTHATRKSYVDSTATALAVAFGA
ncbi:MAG: hypothetical protein CMA64_06445 [Euryarchaeota archaeon]|nr:hypothetical protein [Euryarchaeota archaeon]